MNRMQCAYCYSTRVKIRSAYEARQVAAIQCLDCGKTSEVDTENFNSDPDELTQEHKIGFS